MAGVRRPLAFFILILFFKLASTVSSPEVGPFNLSADTPAAQGAPLDQVARARIIEEDEVLIADRITEPANMLFFPVEMKDARVSSGEDGFDEVDELDYARTAGENEFYQDLTYEQNNSPFSASEAADQNVFSDEFDDVPASAREDAFDRKVIRKIAFGSCCDHKADQRMWNGINEFHPDIFIWLGDIIYADDELPYTLWGRNRTCGPFKNTPKFVMNSVVEMKRRYDIQKNIPGYMVLRNQTKVLGIYDDHDMGFDNVGKEYPLKQSSQKLLLDFLDEPSNSSRRHQEGAYVSYTFGPPNKTVKIILLDTRYHRDRLYSNGDFLGNAQWAWFEEQLRGPSTNLTIIGSSVQVISNISHFIPLLKFEGWAVFPKERQRLFKLLKETKRNGTFFISGDVHLAEITKIDCVIEYSLHEFTSSGITQFAEMEVGKYLGGLFRLAVPIAGTNENL